MPYGGTFDCFQKILRYECNQKHGSNFQSFYAGLEAYYIRFFLIALTSQYLLDYYHSNAYVQEFWQPRLACTCSTRFERRNGYL